MPAGRPWSWPSLALVPPSRDLARRTEYAEALQFALLAIVVPALVAVGAPWRRLGLAGARPGRAPRLIDRLADRRRRHRELPAVAGLHRVRPRRGRRVARARRRWPPWPRTAGWCSSEALSLLVFGLGLWLELVTSPPLVPRSGHLRRAVLGAFAMWAFWILAYVTGLSNHGFYRNFHHAAGGLSAAADQQIASAVLWFVAARHVRARDLLERARVAADGGGPRRRAAGPRPGGAPAGHAAVHAAGRRGGYAGP